MFRATGKRQILFILGLAFLLAGCFPPPESNLDEQRDPHYLNGRRRAESQDHQGAIEEFEKALEVNPHNASAHFELGVLYENFLKDYAAAICHYEKFRQLSPKSENAEKARERISVCKRDLAGSEFLPPTTQIIQKQLDRLTLENKTLHEQVSTLEAQLKERSAAAARIAASAPVSAPSVSHATPQTAASPSTPVNPSPKSPQPPPPSAAPAEPTTYVVASGDTMNKIARQHKIKVSKLESANPGVDSRHLKVGQKLVIPAP